MNEKWKKKSRKLARRMYWEQNDRDSYTCPDCGRSEDELINSFEVHHKDGRPLDNSPENHVALCRPCHNLREGKKPSIAEIQNLQQSVVSTTDTEKQQSDSSASHSEIRSVYLAGSMSYNGEDSWWSESIPNEPTDFQGWRSVIGNEGPVKINSPRDQYFDHGADLVEGVVATDIGLLDESDAILAYFNKKEQTGTFTELMHALSDDKPALVLFNSKFISPPAITPFEHTDRSYQWVGHSIGQRIESRVYWFLLNYMLGDHNPNPKEDSWPGVNSQVQVGVVSDLTGIREAYHEWMKPVWKSSLESYHSNKENEPTE